MKRLVAGTTNHAKIGALRTLLAPVAEIIEVPVAVAPTIEEVGCTIAEIAASKANGWAQWLAANAIALPVIVTDGGLTIPALAGWMPTRTRRFAGDNLTPPQLARSLLELAAHLEGDARRIGWTEVVAIVAPDGRTTLYSAESPPGRLAASVRPDDLAEPDGFWVPAVWLCPEFGMKRLVDLTEEERARRPDHWDCLGETLRENLDRILDDQP